MTDPRTASEFLDEANRGIVGLAPAPWAEDDAGLNWPTEGYDSTGVRYDWAAFDRGDVFGFTGMPKAEWLKVADAMIARWHAWKAHVESIPEAP